MKAIVIAVLCLVGFGLLYAGYAESGFISILAAWIATKGGL